ncbi:CCA tRNA nucleotidyltransferase [Neobacillus vireti]|uniref:CCA-adding enzyme n=1 Tax=Neobacillus vireti LMG 21834 TaxID=1131730 RepID=A0AB94IHV9_9BACI|nr:CCA tRNA nucleotidyltransferase [Neobacillus vireti]ETI66621.1 tRNA CCA-pyrophosphorylase [Neobacillus vireti LMG 21834]KLT17187.1 tRNA nucleotidyltransferase [Neobacillus vireti]
MIEPFLSANPVLRKLEDAGYEAYFVGGSVRDYLLKRRISDVDIAASATPDEVKSIFPKTVDIGIEHGTVLVLFNGGSYEITTFRTEAEYKDFRRPKEVAFIRNLQDDLKRRDFTMNAIAMDRNGKLIDSFDGQTAIKDKVIQTVGKAEERFGEDALRMLRAVRFVSQLSFTIETNTLTALIKQVDLLKNIAVERKKAEFEKLLGGKNRNEAIKVLLKTNLFLYLPGLATKEKHLKQLINFQCDSLNKNEMWSILLFCLDIQEKEVVEFLREWRMAIKDIRAIQQQLLFLEKRLQHEWSVFDLYHAGYDNILSVEKLYLVINGMKETDSINHWLDLYDKLPIKHPADIKVTGNDVMKWLDKSGGPWLKETLVEIENAIVARKLENNKQKIKEWLMACNPN